jgi:predicted exporter
LLAAVALSMAFLMFQRETVVERQFGEPESRFRQAINCWTSNCRADLGAPDVRYPCGYSCCRSGTSRCGVRAGSRRINAIDRGAPNRGDSIPPSRILPSLKTQRERQSALPDPNLLRRNLKQAMQGLPFRDDAFEPFIKDVMAAKTAPLLDRTSLDGTGLAVSLILYLLSVHTAGWQ